MRYALDSTRDTRHSGGQGEPSWIPTTAASLPLPAVFALDPRMYACAALVSSWQPVSILQVVAGAERASDPGVRATISQAIVLLGARTLVVCSEAQGPPTPGLPPSLAACRSLGEDAVLGPLLRAHAVVLGTLWLDVGAGAPYYREGSEGHFARLDEARRRQLFRDLFARSPHPPSSPVATGP